MAHTHTHKPLDGNSKNISLAFFLNLGFAIFEVFGGIYTHSLAITSDALHDFGDSISLGVSWYFEKISKRPPSQKFSYGLKRFSLVGAIINSLVLLTGSIIILIATIPRLFNPQVSDAKGMFVFAIIGIVINGYAVLRLQKGKSLNAKVVSLHLLEDVLGWIAVLLGSILMYFFNIPIIDPILSLAISLFILFNVFKNMKSVMTIILQGVPEGVELAMIEKALKEIPGVHSIHDLHIWSMDNEYTILSVHLVSSTAQGENKVKQEARELLKNQFDITHATIEIEALGEECNCTWCN
ncbi:MAG: cation diffusion facilitator family transporter [Bacteroidales bacterium]